MEAIVIKTYSRCKITGDMGVEYEVVTNPLRKGKMMTKEEAMQYVEKHGLVKAIEGKDGVVWDTPGREFQTKWKFMGRAVRYKAIFRTIL